MSSDKDKKKSKSSKNSHSKVKSKKQEREELDKYINKSFSRRLKHYWKLFNYLLWKDESWLGWTISIIFAFVVVKFVIFPIFSLILGTSYPIVAVVSGSMSHDNLDFDSWWNLKIARNVTQSDLYELFNITKQQFLSFPLHNGFNRGDVIIIKGTMPKEINVGDVIVYHARMQKPIIHRVIKKWEHDGKYYFMTKGDHNPGIIKSPFLDETNISENQVVGKAVFKIPYIGLIKIWTVDFLRCLIFHHRFATVC